MTTDEYDENYQRKSRRRHTKKHPKQSREASSIKKNDHVYEEMKEDKIGLRRFPEVQETKKEGFHT